MPVKEKVNKSEEVRKLKAAGITSASEIMAKLKARGITVAPAQVYTLLAKKKGKKKAKHQGQSVGDKDTIIDHAVVFVRSAGGMTRAKELLSKLATLQS